MDEKDKIKLSDVLGGLVSGVAYGRNVADVQALSIALRYQQNSLLKGLPVPRLRLSEVSISLPLIMTAAIPGTAPILRDPTDIIEEATKSFKKGIDEEIKHLNYMNDLAKLSGDEKTWVERHIDFLNYALHPYESNDKKDKLNVKTAEEKFREVFGSSLKNSFARLGSSNVSTHVDASIRNMVGDIAEKSFRSVMSEIFFRFSKADVDKQAIKKAIEAEEEARKKAEEEEARRKAEGSMNKRFMCTAAAPTAKAPEKAEEPDAFSDLKFDIDRAKKNAEEIMGTESTMRLIDSIRAAAEAATISKPGTEPDFYVEVDTDSIKNAGGGPDTVTRLRIVLHEEGLEWLSETHQGTETSRLMPE